jgi:hypothetical protein
VTNNQCLLQAAADTASCARKQQQIHDLAEIFKIVYQVPAQAKNQVQAAVSSIAPLRFVTDVTDAALTLHRMRAEWYLPCSFYCSYALCCRNPACLTNPMSSMKEQQTKQKKRPKAAGGDSPAKRAKKSAQEHKKHEHVQKTAPKLLTK